MARIRRIKKYKTRLGWLLPAAIVWGFGGTKKKSR